jgi:hypothetical protein
MGLSTIQQSLSRPGIDIDDDLLARIGAVVMIFCVSSEIQSLQNTDYRRLRQGQKHQFVCDFL